MAKDPEVLLPKENQITAIQAILMNGIQAGAYSIEPAEVVIENYNKARAADKGSFVIRTGSEDENSKDAVMMIPIENIFYLTVSTIKPKSNIVTLDKSITRLQ